MCQERGNIDPKSIALSDIILRQEWDTQYAGLDDPAARFYQALDTIQQHSEAEFIIELNEYNMRRR